MAVLSSSVKAELAKILGLNVGAPGPVVAKIPPPVAAVQLLIVRGTFRLRTEPLTKDSPPPLMETADCASCVSTHAARRV